MELDTICSYSLQQQVTCIGSDTNGTQLRLKHIMGHTNYTTNQYKQCNIFNTP